MHILFIRQNYPPERGPFKYIYNLANSLAGRGHDITVITGLPHYPDGKPYNGYGRILPRIKNENGVRVIRLPLIMASNRRPVVRIIGFFSFALILFPVLLFCRRPDVMVCSIPPVTVGIPGICASVLRRIPLVMLLHDFEPLRSLELRGMIEYPFARGLVRVFTAVYNRAASIVVMIEDEFRALLNYGADPEKIMIIPHGVDFERFNQLAEQDIPFKLPKVENRKIALYLGTVGMAHDIEASVRAFAYHKIRDLPIEFYIVGDGECVPICREIIEQKGLHNVRIFPSVEIEWIPAVLRQADILVMSQRPRSFSLGSKFCEYAASGKPILVNSDGILAKTIEEAGAGWVFDANDPETLYESLLRYLYSSDADIEEIRKKSLDYTRTNLASQTRHDLWERLLYSSSQ